MKYQINWRAYKSTYILHRPRKVFSHPLLVYQYHCFRRWCQLMGQFPDLTKKTKKSQNEYFYITHILLPLHIFLFSTPLQACKGRVQKKTIESVRMLIPRGDRGVSASQRSHLLRFFFSMLQTYLLGSKKPKNKFCVYSLLNILYSFSFIWPSRSSPSP